MDQNAIFGVQFSMSVIVCAQPGTAISVPSPTGSSPFTTLATRCPVRRIRCSISTSPGRSPWPVCAAAPVRSRSWKPGRSWRRGGSEVAGTAISPDR